MHPHRLFHRDFTILILGQIASLFGNAILRFALSLYVLDLTGSAALFGGILALSMVPTILCSPLGGVLADRAPRQRIMVVLDFFTAALVICFLLLSLSLHTVALAGIWMVLLSAIQAFYQPSVQASIPLLTAQEHLMAANGVVVQVQSLASLLGPILGGLLYGLFGLFPILAASSACFFASAVMELFLRIPFQKKLPAGRASVQLRADLVEAAGFLRREQPVLLRTLLIVAGINLFFSSLYMVGLPCVVKLFLGLSDQHYGFAEAAMGLGSVIGGLLAGRRSGLAPFSRSARYLYLAAAALLPCILAVLSPDLPLLSYTVLLGCTLVCMAATALFSVAAQTYIQQVTPPRLLGKVSSFTTAISVCAFPLGQAMYGLLFDALAPWMVMALGMAASLILSRLTGRALAQLAHRPGASPAG